MTMDEATITQTRRYPVIIKWHSDSFEAGEYRIKSISKSYHNEDKTYIYSATLERRQKALYVIGLPGIAISPKYEKVLEQDLVTLRRNKLKAAVRDYVEHGENKTTITKLIKALFDEIKNNK